MIFGVVLAGPLRAGKPLVPARPWSALETRKATIGRIEVEDVDVFDLANPKENVWLGRLADRLHATTREVVIRRVLLFQAGDPVHARLIYETERLLRALPFLKDAHIEPVVQPDGTVVAKVRVREAWTTQVSAGFASVGGQRSMNFGVEEKNFLGLGKSVGFAVSRDQQRSTWGFDYLDPQFLGSRWVLGLQDQFLSDGAARSLALGRPFYALATPWSATLALAQKRTDLYLYDRGAQIFQAPFAQDAIQLAGAAAFRRSGDRVWRGGLLFNRQDTQYGSISRTGPAADPLQAPTLASRRLRGPALTLATEQDAFDTFQDFLGMDSPEDYNLAWNGTLNLGLYTPALGSSMTAPFFLAQGTQGWSSSPDELTLLTVNLSGRAPASGLQNGQMNLTLTQYAKVTPNQILAGFAAVDLGDRLDPEGLYYLGGDQGMRGYPDELHPGDARWLVSGEYRMLTGQRWWGIVRLGYDVFFDTGAIRQLNGQGWSRNYSDAGFGFRLGNLKSSIGRVILISLAVPLAREPYQARFQVTVGNTMRF